jgi:hypothetical protein
MRHSPSARLAAFFLTLLLGDFALAQAQAPFENPKVKIVYNKPQNQALLPIYTQLQKYQVLEELKQFLTPLRLPVVLTLQADECGSKTRPYKHGGPVTICYELIAEFEGIIAQHTAGNPDLQRTLNSGAIVEALLHEIAYAIFDIYEVPIWGRVDDAADRVSAFIMLQFGEDIALGMIEGTANLFLWSNKTWSGKDFASPSSPEAQRFYNYVCIAYGFDQKIFRVVVANGTLPAERAARCVGEYEQVKKAFNLRIMPFIDPDVLVKAKAHEW